MTPMNTEEVITAVKKWYKTLPPSVATFAEHETPHEQVVRVTPRVSGAAWIEFRIARYGKMDICFGTAACHEEVEPSPQLAVAICEAVRRGEVAEEVRHWKGRRISTRTVLQLPDGARLQCEETTLLGLLPIGHIRRSEFLPWS